MSFANTQVTITEGLAVDDPWTITELDTNIKNLAFAILVAKGASQGAALRTQTAVLREQTNTLEAISDNAKQLGLGAVFAPVVDSSGKSLISDTNVVSDLIGRQASSLTTEESNRLVDFTGNLVKSASPVNLGGQTYVSVTVSIGIPPSDSVIQVPIAQLSSDPTNVSVSSLKPFVYYQYKDSNGKLIGRILDEKGSNLSVVSVSDLPRPNNKFVYDAYQLETGSLGSGNIKTYPVVNIVGPFSNTAPSTTLYRNLVTGELRLIGSAGPVAFFSSKALIIPSSKQEIDFFLGQSGADRLRSLSDQLKADGIDLTIPPNMVEWKFKDFPGGGFASYPIVEGDPTSSSFPVGSLVQDSTTKKIYSITARVGNVNSFFEIETVKSPFVFFFTQENIVKLRGQYTEEITRLTQRTTEQQLFLNSLLLKQNFHLDAATNVFKAFTDLNTRQAGLL